MSETPEMILCYRVTQKLNTGVVTSELMTTDSFYAISDFLFKAKQPLRLSYCSNNKTAPVINVARRSCTGISPLEFPFYLDLELTTLLADTGEDYSVTQIETYLNHETPIEGYSGRTSEEYSDWQNKFALRRIQKHLKHWSNDKTQFACAIAMLAASDFEHKFWVDVESPQS